MKAPEKSTCPCPPSSTHTWVPSFSQVSVQSRLTVSVSHQASGQQAGHHGTTGVTFPRQRAVRPRPPGQEAMAAARGLPHPHPGPVSGPQARAAPMPPTWCPCPVQRPHTPTPWPAPHCPTGPGAVRGTRSPTGLTASGLTGGVSGSRRLLGASTVHSQGRCRNCWRPVGTGSQAAGSAQGRDPEGQPRRAHPAAGRQGLGGCSFPAGVCPGAQPAPSHPGRQLSSAVPRWPTGSCQHAFFPYT